MKTEYVTVQNLANVLGLKRRAVLKHITVGNLPATRFGHVFLITADDAMAFMRKRSEGKHIRRRKSKQQEPKQ